jgi:dipeptidase
MKIPFLVLLMYTSVTFSPSDSPGSAQECFMVLVGKSASRSGSVMLAHNNDLTGKEESFVEIIPASDREGFSNVRYSDQLSIELPAKTYKVLIQRIGTGFKEGDAVAVNEFGVAIAGGVALGDDRNSKAEQFAPLIPNGLPGGIRYDVLARSRTARECVEMLGDAYYKYGVSYPSGVGIADSNEIWYIECGGGKQWAAVRIPDTCYWVQANGYRIGEIDTSDKDYYLTSPDLLEYCSNNNLWDPQSGPFNFAKVFGGGRTEKEGGLKYDRLRIWRAIDLLSPSLNPDPSDNSVVLIKPDQPLTEIDLFNLMRDYFQSTPYDKSLRHTSDKELRAIATHNGVHSSLIVISPSGSVLWSGIGPSLVIGFIPIPFGVTIIPLEYSHGSSGSVFDTFRRLSDKSSGDWGKIKQIQGLFINNEREFVTKLEQLLHSGYNDPEKLNSFTQKTADATMETAGHILRIN